MISRRASSRRRPAASRRSDLDTLNTELTAWQHATNTHQRQVNWPFAASDARTKLRHLYPER
jgi:hypothetical protein